MRTRRGDWSSDASGPALAASNRALAGAPTCPALRRLVWMRLAEPSKCAASAAATGAVGTVDDLLAKASAMGQRYAAWGTRDKRPGDRAPTLISVALRRLEALAAAAGPIQASAAKRARSYVAGLVRSSDRGCPRSARSRRGIPASATVPRERAAGAAPHRNEERRIGSGYWRLYRHGPTWDNAGCAGWGNARTADRAPTLPSVALLRGAGAG